MSIEVHVSIELVNDKKRWPFVRRQIIEDYQRMLGEEVTLTDPILVNQECFICWIITRSSFN